MKLRITPPPPPSPAPSTLLVAKATWNEATLIRVDLSHLTRGRSCCADWNSS